MMMTIIWLICGYFSSGSVWRNRAIKEPHPMTEIHKRYTISIENIKNI